MTEVYCSSTECKYNKQTKCEAESIRLDDMECMEYADYTETAPEYQEIYYTANEREAVGGKVKFRVEKKGLKYEWCGFTVYTSNDIRYGIEDAYFTEAKTGVLFPMDELQRGEIDADTIREKLKEYPDVMSLPLFVWKNGEFMEADGAMAPATETEFTIK